MSALLASTAAHENAGLHPPTIEGGTAPPSLKADPTKDTAATTTSCFEGDAAMTKPWEAATKTMPMPWDAATKKSTFKGMDMMVNNTATRPFKWEPLNDMAKRPFKWEEPENNTATHPFKAEPTNDRAKHPFGWEEPKNDTAARPFEWEEPTNHTAAHPFEWEPKKSNTAACPFEALSNNDMATRPFR